MLRVRISTIEREVKLGVISIQVEFHVPTNNVPQGLRVDGEKRSNMQSLEGSLSSDTIRYNGPV